MLAEVHIEQAAIDVGVVAAEKAARIQSLPHFLQHQGHEHPFKALGDRVDRMRIPRAKLGSQHLGIFPVGHGRNGSGLENVHGGLYSMTRSAWSAPALLSVWKMEIRSRGETP